MNTSAFVTAIRIKLAENQHKTYFFLFAFCLFIAGFSIERIMGNLLSERLELERKKDFSEGIETAFDQRWKLHEGHIRSYAFWQEVWDLIKSKKSETVYLNFQADTSIDKQFDYFAIYLSPEKEFITKWSDGSGRKIDPNEKTISYLYGLQSRKEGQSNRIVFFNQQYYLVSISSLANNIGNPMLDGIMIFAYELDKFISNTNSLFHIKMQIIEGEELPNNHYHSFNLESLQVPNTNKITIIYSPETLRSKLIRPYLISILALFGLFSLGVFSWVLYKLKNPFFD